MLTDWHTFLLLLFFFFLSNGEAHTWSLHGLSTALVLQSQGLNTQFFCNLHERLERMLWSSFSFRATEGKASGASPDSTQLTDFEMDLLHHTHSWKLIFLCGACPSSSFLFASCPIGSSFFFSAVFFIQAPVMSNPSWTSDTCFDPFTCCSLWGLLESFGCCDAQRVPWASLLSPFIPFNLIISPLFYDSYFVHDIFF